MPMVPPSQEYQAPAIGHGAHFSPPSSEYITQIPPSLAVEDPYHGPPKKGAVLLTPPKHEYLPPSPTPEHVILHDGVPFQVPSKEYLAPKGHSAAVAPQHHKEHGLMTPPSEEYLIPVDEVVPAHHKEHAVFRY